MGNYIHKQMMMDDSNMKNWIKTNLALVVQHYSNNNDNPTMSVKFDLHNYQESLTLSRFNCF